ncbi:MAG TPA: DUF6585 family protein [Ktedonobacteraceae bacterium]|jgi:hypothetical protein|nr:DUF6585 family protein [Ktedonobacteraceae bacterium]
MSEENPSSPYAAEQDDYMTTAHSLPYIEKYSPPSSTSPPQEQSIVQPRQEATGFTNIDLLTTTYQLGKVQKIYKNDYASDMTRGLISCILGVLCFLPLLFASSNGGASLPTIGSLRGSFGLILLGFLLFGYGINRTISGINKFITNTHHKNPQYYLCSHGILLLKGKQIQALRWDQINIAQKNVLTGPPYLLQYYVLRPLDDREPLVLEPIVTGVEGLIMQIEREIARYFLPRSIAAYRAGHRLNFGPLEVTSQGLSMQGGEKNLSWETLGSVDVREGTLMIKEKGTLSMWANIDMSELYNACIFLPLIHQIKQDRLSGEVNPNPLPHRSPIHAPLPPSEWQEYE